VPISIPESLVVALPPILSPSSRTFVELTLVNWRRPWGSRRLDFVIWAGSFNFSIGDISKFFLYHQDQQILRLPTTEAVRSIQQNLSSTSAIIYIVKIFNASPSRIINFVQVDRSRTTRENQYTPAASLREFRLGPVRIVWARRAISALPAKIIMVDGQQANRSVLPQLKVTDQVSRKA
jgi:hypothetical protein